MSAVDLFGNERTVTMRPVYKGKRDDCWATPTDLFNALNAEFGFTLDAAADAGNALCERFFSWREDGLRQDWSGEVVWCNPPYSEAARWIEKGHHESLKGATVVMLLPVRTGNRSWHEHIHGIAEIRFCKGRLRFGGTDSNAPFDSAIVVWRSATQGGMG